MIDLAAGLRRRIEDVIEAVFPTACRRCGHALPDERAVPRTARPYAALWNGQLRRPVCGSWSLPTRLLCGGCAGGLVRSPRAAVLLDGTGLRCVTPFEPTPVLFELIHAMKYESQVQIAPWFAAFMAAALRGAAGPDSLLVPVPLHARRERVRGFNQSQLLAAVIARRSGLPLGADLVQRARDTPAQAQLPHAARHSNLAGAFRRTGRVPVRGQVVIVDDVVTTGATVAAVAAALDVDPGRVLVTAVCCARPGAE